MFNLFLQLEWKSFFRSASFGKNLAIKIFMGFLAVYFGVVFLLLGIGLYPMLQEITPNHRPMQVLNNYVVLWLLAELVMRGLMQSLPVMNVRPLLTSNIKRKSIIHYLLIKSLFSFYNFLAPLAIIPFGIWCWVKGDYSLVSILSWQISMIALMLCINYGNFLVSKKFADNSKGLIPFIILAIALAGLDYFNVFSITKMSGQFMNVILAYPFMAFIPLILLCLLYKMNFMYLKNNIHLDAANFKNRQSQNTAADLSWTKHFGSIAPFLQLDLRLIGRNKRAKGTIFMSILFAAYGLIFFNSYDNITMMLPFLGIFMTGIFVINFGQFIPAWDSSYYSMMMTQNIPMKQYLNSKAGLMYGSIIVMTLLTTPYVYFGLNVLLINIACAIYNAGINVPIILYAGSFNKKRIDLDKSQFMNYQGTGATQWIVGIPLLLIPIIVWIGCYFIFNETVAIIYLALLGIIGLLCRNVFMNKIEKVYRRNKYAMVEGFKQIL